MPDADDKLLHAPPDLDVFDVELPRLQDALTRRIDADPDKVERGLAQLVLTVVELLRQLMERQALRRIDVPGARPPDDGAARAARARRGGPQPGSRAAGKVVVGDDRGGGTVGVLRGLGRAVGGLLAGVGSLVKNLLQGVGGLLRRLV
jgi:hypothetical protein